MTPAEEAEFIRLWTAGMEQVEIARQLGIPRGTVSSRASTLVRQGKIQARPRGGSYPKQKVRQEGSPSTVHHLRWTRYRPPRYHGRSTRLPSTVYRPPSTQTPGS
jgi:DNA-binding transcriptional MocR family regulator